MNPHNRDENRADVVRVLLAVGVLALLSLLDDSPRHAQGAAQSAAVVR